MQEVQVPIVLPEGWRATADSRGVVIDAFDADGRMQGTVNGRPNDTAGAVVMALIAVAIFAIYATGLLPLPAWFAALF